ncbi:MAG TPA: serine/threonine-protein kinase [Kofleriaceae bacterium]|nr:serine/threonine-protein kinase [Kofleriaceae bacterium]
MPPEILAIGHRIADRYVVRDVLGHGAMGAVYEVEGADGVRHAMKSALPDLDDGGEAVRRLAREGNALQLLAHDNIVGAVDQVAEGGRLFVIMELARGKSLSELVMRGALEPRRALVLARQILDGVEHAHARGVVHRDLKPDNVVVTMAGTPEDPFERVKILDFGLVKLLDDAAAMLGGSKLTRTGIAFGTPAYIAPESAQGRPIDGRADLYAIGIMLFEMLTGRLPFVETDAGKLLRAHVSSPAPQLGDVAPGAPFVTPAMEVLVGGALAKKPEQRFANAAAMRACLDEAFLSLQ